MRIFLCRNIIDKVESTIQLWNDAKQAKFWLPWPTMCPGLEESDFRAYAKACRNLERTDLERGFRIHINRRQIAAFFVFDRQSAQDDGAPPPEVNVRVWGQFITTFEECYLACRDDLKDALVEHRIGSWSRDNYTMANELFDIDPAIDTKWWPNIMAKITWLQARDPPFCPHRSRSPMRRPLKHRLPSDVDCMTAKGPPIRRQLVLPLGSPTFKFPISPQSSIMRPQSEWVA